MGFANLRVINEDSLIPGGGFAAHDHTDMEIITLVLYGQLHHEDDQGNIASISAGEVQGMSAGTGVRHSEYNGSTSEPSKFLQIWLIPDQVGGQPAYTQASVPNEMNVLLAAPATLHPLIPLRSEARLTLRRFTEGQELALSANGESDHFVHLLDGLAYAEQERLSADDGLQVPRSEQVTLRWHTDGAALVFDMPSPAAMKETKTLIARSTEQNSKETQRDLATISHIARSGPRDWGHLWPDRSPQSRPANHCPLGPLGHARRRSGGAMDPRPFRRRVTGHAFEVFRRNSGGRDEPTNQTRNPLTPSKLNNGEVKCRNTK